MHDIALLLNCRYLIAGLQHNISNTNRFLIKKFCSLTHEKRRECAEKRQTN